MVDDPGPNLYKPPDYGLYRRLDSLAPERRVPDHVEQVIGEASDEDALPELPLPLRNLRHNIR